MKARTVRRYLSAVLLLTVTPLIARADEASVRKEVNAAFDRAIKAFKAKDIKAFMSMYTPDYTSKMANGQTRISIKPRRR